MTSNNDLINHLINRETLKSSDIIDIGSGSGWTTALLSFIVGDKGSITRVQRVESLVNFRNTNLKKYRFKNSKIIQATNELGIVGKKFNRILVSAAANDFPYSLIEQLKIGGKLLIPVKNSIYEVTKSNY